MNLGEISKGITHIEELDTSDFLRVATNLVEYEVTEKVDGSQILFGIDEHGFYTSRETKGGDRVYAVEDYNIHFSTTYRRAAHKLLESVLPQLKEAGLKPGDQVEAEVLYGELPNVVPYSEDSNYLIFLRTTEGSINIDRLKQKLDGLSLSVSLTSPLTEDGKSISLVEKADHWTISSVPLISVQYPYVQKKVEKKLKEMRAFLLQDTKFGIPNMTVEKTPLNRIPAWCSQAEWKTVKEELKAEKARVQLELDEMKLAVKEILLDHFVRPYSSMFGPIEGGWIEGVVLKHRENGKMVKVVDKRTFGTIREFAWQVRNSLTERARGINDSYSYLGEVHVGLATALGHPELGTMQCKKYHKQMVFEDNTPIEPLKEYMLSFLEQKRIDLEGRLDKYEKEKHKLVLKVVEGTFKHKVGYAESGIDRRTKETFASLFEQISVLMDKISTAQSQNDLVQAIAGRYLT
jgi:hypothetical protein